MSLTRREAMSDINLGRGICLTFTNEDTFGKRSAYNLILRRSLKRGYVEALIDCRVMRRSYRVTLTAKQALAYIKRNYPRHDDFTVELRAILTLAEVA